MNAFTACRWIVVALDIALAFVVLRGGKKTAPEPTEEAAINP
jgi:hypothetical protein